MPEAYRHAVSMADGCTTSAAGQPSAGSPEHARMARSHHSFGSMHRAAWSHRATCAAGLVTASQAPVSAMSFAATDGVTRPTTEMMPRSFCSTALAVAVLYFHTTPSINLFAPCEFCNMTQKPTHPPQLGAL